MDAQAGRDSGSRATLQAGLDLLRLARLVGHLDVIGSAVRPGRYVEEVAFVEEMANRDGVKKSGVFLKAAGFIVSRFSCRLSCRLSRRL